MAHPAGMAVSNSATGQHHGHQVAGKDEVLLEVDEALSTLRRLVACRA